jgi:hypothetical protein
MSSYRRRAAMLAGAIVTTVGCGTAQSSPPKPEPVQRPHVDKIVAIEPGRCVVVYASDCPVGEPCPPETHGKETVACPPYFQESTGWRQLHHFDGACSLMVDMTCPPDATCNPPPPEPFECPARYRPKPKGPRVVKKPDGSCVEVFDVQCPPDMRCNPPPPRPVPCPEEEEATE